MNTTTHPFTKEEVMAFLDGELSAERSQSFSTHLEACSECGEVVASLRSTSHSLSNWTAGIVPSHLEKWVLDRSIATSNVSEKGFLSKLGRFSRLPPALVFAAAAVAFVLILIAGNAPRYQRIASAPPRAVDYAIEPPATEGQGSGGKLGSSAPAASLMVRPAVPPGDRLSGLSFDDATKILPPPPPPPGKPQVQSKKMTTKSGTEPTAPMIARTVLLSIVAKDCDASRASLDSILARHRGYAAELNVATPQSAARTLQASLRIPAAQLVAAVAELKTLGRVENENQIGEEITQQHADLVARLKNSRETEERLQDVLRTRTGRVKDVLEVEEEIARVRGEIEQMEAEQQTLEHRVDFATVDLKLTEEYKAQLTTPAPSVARQFRNACIDGFRSAFDSLLALVLFFAEAGPTLLLWLMILSLPAWLVWRRYRRFRMAEAPLGV
jgi:hypothetical protein